MIKALTTVSNPGHQGWLNLKQSLDKFGWEYEVFSNYQQFGSKQKNAYEYMKAHPELKHAFIIDAYDVLVLDTPEELMKRKQGYRFEQITFNSEKNCWPYPDWHNRYPETFSPWRYLNGGVALVDCETFIRMYEDSPIKDSDNDQVNLANIYLDKRHEYGFQLDTQCVMFQSIAFETEGDFTFGDKFKNEVTLTHPMVVHANGGGTHNLQKIFDLYIK